VSQALGILRVAPEEQRLPETLLVASSSEKIRYPAGVVPASVRTAVGDEMAALPAVPAGGEGVPSDSGAPSALGLSARQALALFARQGLSARVVGSGFVVEQKPAPGAPVRAGAVCILRLAESAAAPAQGTGRRAEESAATLPGP